jgi:CMP-N-acetylneuraminic acid synthetase
MLIGFIPARGGSKGIKSKNLQAIGQTTLLGLGVKKLKEIGCGKVLVSTDSEEISKMAEFYGAEVVMRPSHLALDDSSTLDVVLDLIESKFFEQEDVVILHQVTSPLISNKSMLECISELLNSEMNSVITTVQSNSYLWQSNNELWDPAEGRGVRLPRQKVVRRAIESGGAYCFKVNAVSRQKTIYPEPTLCTNIPYIEGLDIDTHEDLEQAREIFVQLNL